MSDRSLHSANAAPWKSLESLSGAVDYKESEFPEEGPMAENVVSRRGFMTIMSASMALTAAACRRPEQRLVPSVKSLQTAIPGMPLEYASVYTKCNVAYGALVKTREGRPIKVKGNDLHPINTGRTSAEMQASLLSLYDSDRLRRPRVRKGGGGTSYDNALLTIAEGIAEAHASGKKAVFVVGEHASPSYAALMQHISEAIPTITFVTMPSIAANNAAIANRAAIGIDAELVPDLSKAKVIVCVDADPLGADPLALYHTTKWSQRRKPVKANKSMSKMIVAEAQYSLTGGNCDERIKLHPSQVEPFLAVIEKEIAGSAALGSDVAALASAEVSKHAMETASALKGAVGESYVMAGRHLSPRAHAIALNINNSLGNVGAGSVVDPSMQIPFSGDKSVAISALTADLMADNVHMLAFCDANPEYNADRAFRTAMMKAPFRVAINLYEDETAEVCNVSIPGTHWLESWGDAVAFDGTLSMQQPMIAPMNDGVASVQDSLMRIALKVGERVSIGTLPFTAEQKYADFVKNRWYTMMSASVSNTDAAWRKTLQDGILIMPHMPAASLTFNGAAAAQLSTGQYTSGRVVAIAPSLSFYDGQYSNNSWLQELPDPVTKIVWDNAALMSPATAIAIGAAKNDDPKELALASQNVVTVSTEHGSVNLPVWVQVGMADDVVAISLGYGRTAGGAVSMNVGANGFALASGTNTTQYMPLKNISLVAGTKYRVATTQNHHTLDDGRGERPVAKWVSFHDVQTGHLESLEEEFPNTGKDGKFLIPISIVPDYEYKGHRWGMVIDMSACTGCSSCIIACQSENNIPVVGKDQVLIGREMHWIRLDRYYVGDMSNPISLNEPMLCQHCENAPCENVCPVAATTHSPEGLNEMTYNRCVGTRYCLNNCPYKVRRFNFLNFHDTEKSPLDLVFNPNVTNRMRGVMEKCTFCVQRLHEAKWHARDAGRERITDGEAVVACQEACPAGAIIFGDTNDASSRVAQLRNEDRGFKVLSELNVRPQITYLAKVRNS